MTTPKSVRRYQITLLISIIIVCIAINAYWNKLEADGRQFLKDTDLKVSFKVIDIKPTGDHGYGAIYGQLLSSNKPSTYIALRNNKCLFCKTEKGKIIIVSDFSSFNKNDSVVINSRERKYWVYRKGAQVEESVLTVTSDFFLYSHLNEDKLLDFPLTKNDKLRWKKGSKSNKKLS